MPSVDSVVPCSSCPQVKLVGEGADDAGGVFDDTITEMCRELEDEGSDKLDLLVRTPNGRAETGLNRDRFLFNPEAGTERDLRHFWFLGEN